jgi:hypothetical protein
MYIGASSALSQQFLIVILIVILIALDLGPASLANPIKIKIRITIKMG